MNNPYLVCSDRELRALPTQQLRAECWDKVGLLLDDLEFMDATVRRLGIDELLRYCASVLHLLPERGDWPTKLATTNRILHRQAHHLRDWDAKAQPAFFLQQLRNEAFQFDLDGLQTRTEAQLAKMKFPYLKEHFQVSHESPALVQTLTGHTAKVFGVAVTPDGQIAVSAAVDGTLKVWDLANGRELSTLKGHTVGVLGVVMTPDGCLVVSSAENGKLKVWDLATGQECRLQNAG